MYKYSFLSQFASRVKVLILTGLCVFVVSAPVMSEAAVKKNKPGKTVQKRVTPKKVVSKNKVKVAPKQAPIAQSQYRKDPYVGALAMDAKTGRVLFADGAGAIARPASVTKLMTALLVLEDVKKGKYSIDSMVSAGPMALRMEPSIIGFMDLKTRKPVSWSVDTLLYALMIRSANDAAVALAEHSAGTMEKFVERMNAKAKSLGMEKTVYYNPNGLPPNAGKRYPWKSFNVTTCYDQAKLAREILSKHPELLKYTSRKTWKMPDGQMIINHNNVMRMDKWKIVNPDGTEAVDGLKTGYINAGGSSVVLTGKCKGRRVIVVVLGSASAQLRDSNARNLMVDALEN
jgi:D-alanyl-D-alanine carboxypeptidase (penicillin-binding protein 5/6)